MSGSREQGPGTISRVGKYMLLETLGEGAFGKVKLAIDERDGQQYAVKIMRKQHIKQQELTLQVRREIAVMKALRHPNIVNLHEVLNSKSTIYMVMDLVRGGELFDAVAEQGRLSESDARMYFQQLTDGILHCHMRHVYHRDIKPENLLLSPDKKILKITDFGLSSIKGANSTTELLHTTMGSPHYIAPEIITSAARGYEGAKVDVWASGVVLFGLLAGYLPFDEERTRDLYKAIVHQPVKYPSHFSKGVTDLISAMLVKDPDRRVTFEEVKKFPWFLVDYSPVKTKDSSSPCDSRKKKKRRSSRRRKSDKRNGTGRRKSAGEWNGKDRTGSCVGPITSEEKSADVSEGSEALAASRLYSGPPSIDRSTASDSPQGSRECGFAKTSSMSHPAKKDTDSFTFSEPSPQAVTEYTPMEKLKGEKVRDEIVLQPQHSGNKELFHSEVALGPIDEDSEDVFLEKKSSGTPLSSAEKLLHSSHPPPPPLPKDPSVDCSLVDEERFLSLPENSENGCSTEVECGRNCQEEEPSGGGSENAPADTVQNVISESNDQEDSTEAPGKVENAGSEPLLPELGIRSSLLERANQLFSLVTGRIGGSYKGTEDALPRCRGMRKEELDDATEVVETEEFGEKPDGLAYAKSSDSCDGGRGANGKRLEAGEGWKKGYAIPTKQACLPSKESSTLNGLFKPVPSIFAPLANGSLISKEQDDSKNSQVNTQRNRDEVSRGSIVENGGTQMPVTDDGPNKATIPLSRINFGEEADVIGEGADWHSRTNSGRPNPVHSLGAFGALGNRMIFGAGVPYSPNGKSNFLMQRQLQRKMGRRNFGLNHYRKRS